MQDHPQRSAVTAADRRGHEYDHLSPALDEFAALREEDPRRAELRSRLVEGFLPLVHHIAARYRDRGEPLDDLHQVGTIGLMNAIERFAPDRGLHFLAYAVPTITGEIRRHFRDRTWAMRVPRALKDLQKPLRDATGALSETLGRAPRPSELAAHLGRPVEEIIDALQAQDAYNSRSLDTPLGVGESSLGDTLGRIDTALETIEQRHALRPLLDQLPERERTILVLRFFGELTQTEIAARVGLSQMHVSRLLAQTLARLRRDLEPG